MVSGDQRMAGDHGRLPRIGICGIILGPDFGREITLRLLILKMNLCRGCMWLIFT